MKKVNAQYTVVLYDLLNNPESKAKIDEALSKYPLYKKKSIEEFKPCFIPTREELNQKILNHYKYREIGVPTFGRFLDELEISMNEIMPYYNDMLFSADQDFNIIYNVDYKRTTDRNTTGDNSSDVTVTDNSESTMNATNTSEDTQNVNEKSVKKTAPGSDLNSTYSTTQADEVNSADEINWNKAENTNGNTTTNNGTTTSTGTNTSKATGDHSEIESITETTKGNFGVVSAQDLVIKYRETIINIEQMIINDSRIQELFMMVY